MGFYDFFSWKRSPFSSPSGTYERLPTHQYSSEDDFNSPPSSSSALWHTILHHRIVLLTGFCTLILGSALTYARLHHTPPYSPLDNYQPLNTLPLTSPQSSILPPPNARAIVSTMYSDSYAIALAVLGHSIRASNVTGRLMLPYLPKRISQQGLCIVQSAGWNPLPVSYIPPPNSGKGVYGRFFDQYTKLNIWTLDKQGFQRVVYLDGDTLVRRSFDELWEIPFDFAAVPDVYEPNDQRGFTVNFNAGVLAIRPSSDTLDVMLSKIPDAKYPPKEAEQAFLNQFFAAEVVRLPYAYNANLAVKTRSKTLWDGMKKETRIVHYTLNKPFLDQNPNVVSLVIPTPEEQRNIVERAKKRYDGLFEEEVGWWGDVFDDMMKSEVGEKLRACYKLESVGEPQQEKKNAYQDSS